MSYSLYAAAAALAASMSLFPVAARADGATVDDVLPTCSSGDVSVRRACIQQIQRLGDPQRHAQGQLASMAQNDPAVRDLAVPAYRQLYGQDPPPPPPPPAAMPMSPPSAPGWPASPSYPMALIDRPATLPRGMFQLTPSFLWARADSGGFSSSSTALGLGAALGVTDRLEIDFGSSSLYGLQLPVLNAGLPNIGTIIELSPKSQVAKEFFVGGTLALAEDRNASFALNATFPILTGLPSGEDLFAVVLSPLLRLRLGSVVYVFGGQSLLTVVDSSFGGKSVTGTVLQLAGGVGLQLGPKAGLRIGTTFVDQVKGGGESQTIVLFRDLTPIYANMTIALAPSTDLLLSVFNVTTKGSGDVLLGTVGVNVRL